MRKEYRRAVRELFTRGMASRFPHFEPIKVKAPILFGGDSVFRSEPKPGVSHFVLLVPDARGRQAFTVEFAWSNAGRFPDVSSRPSVFLTPDDPPPKQVEEGIVRLGSLVSRTDRWWSLPDPAVERPGDLKALQASLEPIADEVALADAETPVQSALTLLQEEGVAFFEAMLE